MFSGLPLAQRWSGSVGLLLSSVLWQDACGMNSQSAVPREVLLIAGKGVYPLEFAQAAKRCGVQRLVVVGFKGETSREIGRWADEIVWLRLGELGALLQAAANAHVQYGVMVGQITPTHIFRVRLDRAMLDLLAALPVKNAETVFSGVAQRLEGVGVKLLPASLFMEDSMPPPGCLTSLRPTERQEQDIQVGLRVAKVLSGLDVGQTVVVKDGIVIAVEAFEGTDETIRRAGRLAGPGTVVVKVAKRGHDMRFDIPVVGTHTLKSLKRARAGVLALEARRTILLERERTLREAERMRLAIVAVATPDSEEAARP